MMLYGLAALLGYALGSLNPAYFLARRRGFDIRSTGSRNAGASNALVTMGAGSAVAVGAFDMAKACGAALLAGLLFPALPGAAAVAGAAAVLGHIFPFYMNFRGGKGFAPFLGLTLAMDWRFFLGLLAAVVLITLITDYVVLGTFTAIVSTPAYLGFFARMGWTAVCAVGLASLVIFVKHFVNIKRLLTGQEIGLRRAMGKKDKV